MLNKKVLIWASPDELGLLPAVAEAVEAPYEVVLRPTGRAMSRGFLNPHHHSGLIIAGDGRKYAQHADHLIYRHERDAILIARDEQIPALYICQGAQNAAVAFGWELRKSPLRCPRRTVLPVDLGPTEIILTPDGKTDALTRHVGVATRLHQCHCDYFIPPVGTTILARSTNTDHPHVDAFRLNPITYGLHAHPEYDTPCPESDGWRIVRAWFEIAGFGLSRSGTNGENLFPAAPDLNVECSNAVRHPAG